MPSSPRQAVEVFTGFGWRAMTSKRRKCMKRLASSAWPSLKNGPKAISMWFSAKHFQTKKTDRPMSAPGHFRQTLRVSAAVQCLLFPESDLLTARQRNDAKGQNRKTVDRFI